MKKPFYAKKEKALALAVITGLIITSTPISSFAMATTEVKLDSISNRSITTSDDKADLSKNLEEILLQVKTMLDIPTEYSELNTHYSMDSNQLGRWSITYSKKDNSERINITVDESGHIIFYRKNTPYSNYVNILKEEANQIANDFIDKVVGTASNSLRLTSSTYNYGNYIYSYERYENNLLVEGNGVRVNVSGEKAEVVHYSSTYNYNVVIPSAQPKITRLKAKDLLNKSIDMKLSYMSKGYNYLNPSAIQEAYLLYQPNSNYISVDANTGTIYEMNQIWNLSTEESMADMVYGYATGSKQDAQLTVIEEGKVDEIKNLMSKEKAINTIKQNKNLNFDTSASKITANLREKKVNNKVSYIWDITFEDPSKVEDYSKYRPYAQASVDAITGNILSYNSNSKEEYMNQKELDKIAPKYSLTKNKTTVADFIKDNAADKMKFIKLEKAEARYSHNLENDKKIDLTHGIKYIRMNEEIEFSNDWIDVVISTTTGKIISYNINWQDSIKFESSKGAMSEGKAYDAFMDEKNFNLVYEMYTEHSLDKESYHGEEKVRLVYKNTMDLMRISPFTGNQLAYDGKEVTEVKEVEISYSDISGLENEKDIRILAQMGIGFSGGILDYYKTITKSELYDFMEKSYFYVKELDSNNLEEGITRFELVDLLIEQLGYSKVASLSGIYQVDFADKNQIIESDIGKVAIITAMGLLSSDSNNEFNGHDYLNRGEALTLIRHLTELQR